MTARVPVYVYALDPILSAGVAGALRPRPEVVLVDHPTTQGGTVAVVAADGLDEATARVIRSLRARGCVRVVLVAAAVDDKALLQAVEAGVCAVVRRSEATAERLADIAVRVAAGEGALPPDLLDRLMTQVSRLQRQVLAPRGLQLNGISSREADVLKLVADGLDTREIAAELAYSERTVKGILHEVMSRFQLRNRAHAVSFAMREGMI